MDKVKLDEVKKLLNKYGKQDYISIFELSRIFTKKFSSLKKDSIIKVSRYFIEARDNNEVNFEESNEEVTNKVFPKIFEVFRSCSLIDTQEMISLRDKTDTVCI